MMNLKAHEQLYRFLDGYRIYLEIFKIKMLSCRLITHTCSVANINVYVFLDYVYFLRYKENFQL